MNKTLFRLVWCTFLLFSSMLSLHAEDFWQDTLWIRKMPFGQNNFAKTMFHPDGKSIFATADNYWYQYDTYTGAIVKTRTTKSGLTVGDYELSPDKQFMYIGTKVSGTTGQSVVEVWHVDTGFVRMMSIKEGEVRSLEVSPDNAFLYIGTDSPTALHKIDVGTMSIIKSNKTVGSRLALSPDGNSLISTFGFPLTSSVLLNTQDLKIHTYLPNYIGAPKFNITGEYIGGRARLENVDYVVLYSTITKESTLMKGHKGDITDVCFTKDGNYLISAGYGQGYLVWDVSKKEKVYEARYPTGGIVNIALSNNSSLYAKVGQGDGIFLSMWKFRGILNSITDNPTHNFGSIIPNPTNTGFILHYPFSDTHTQVRIHDIQGTVLYSVDIQENDISNGFIDINTAHYANGTYFCSVLHNGISVFSSSFIINR